MTRLELTSIVIGAVLLAVWGGCQLYTESKLHAPKTHTVTPVGGTDAGAADEDGGV